MLAETAVYSESFAIMASVLQPPQLLATLGYLYQLWHASSQVISPHATKALLLSFSSASASTSSGAT